MKKWARKFRLEKPVKATTVQIRSWNGALDKAKGQDRIRFFLFTEE